MSECLKGKRVASRILLNQWIWSSLINKYTWAKINQNCIKVMDKFFYSFFNLLDKFSTHLDNVFFPKKRKRKSVKIVNVIVIVKMYYMPIGTWNLCACDNCKH